MDLTMRECEGFDAFIDATNEAGGILGYERMLYAVIRMMEADHGEACARACIDRVLSGHEPGV
jgi:hypothetical protein